MKLNFNKIIGAFAVVLGLAAFTSCSDDEWGDNNAEYKNVFIVSFADWGAKSNNDLKYNVNQGETLEVGVNLFCKGTRSFNAEAFLYVDTQLQNGVDFQIVDEFGTVLPQNEFGAYTLTYDLSAPEEGMDHHRCQKVYVKTIAGGEKGVVNLMTFDPTDVDENGKLRISDGGTKPGGTIYVYNNETKDYTVNCITVNYKAAITIK